MIATAEARRYYESADSAHDFDHVLRVLSLAERIAASEGADLEIVRAAALLHDVGRARASSAGLDHAALGAQMARDILAGHHPARTEAVAQAIAAHRFRSGPDPVTLEGCVLFDADKLDAIGAVGVGRAFAHGGARGQRLWAPREDVDEDQWAETGDDPRFHTPVHEFIVELSHLRERLYTPSGRRIAEERHRFMVAFFEQLDAEVRGAR